ncbi:deoxyribonuclease V [Methylococcus sp. EFPC2]|uniref:deoxyribonuclease V n=1 Tax=Methylococcus sp. EFPC2 TaxID=2812648 RepID=UPI001967C63B|nr:deoxyribonuclease V [Methylococcus sp. EFPC2]QSA96888.1 deoxyribonuclease V [Methylococcus sp. EFPC2]
MIPLPFRHPWNVTPSEAVAIQKSLREYLVLTDDFGEIRCVAGVDCGFEDGGTTTRAAVAVLSFPGLQPVDQAVARLPTTFPYVPGLLSFREVPAILAALEGLRQAPDLLLVDGQGYAHPRRLGIACHLGLLTGLPAIGVGKTRLIGKHDEPPTERGSWVPLLDKGEVVGAVLRSRVGVQPLYVSAGHRIGLATAVDWVMRCTTRYRLPETTRAAHGLASG